VPGRRDNGAGTWGRRLWAARGRIRKVTVSIISMDGVDPADLFRLLRSFDVEGDDNSL
jgi:hypothetical protein